MKTYNRVTLKGRLHSYALEDKEEAIAGTVTLEVDKDGNTAEVRFYATPTYKSGAKNKTYGFLEEMLAGNYNTVSNDGEDADWLSIDANIDVSYFVPRGGAKTVDDLGCAQKLRGAFINPNNKKEYSNEWKCDMLITRIEDREENPEKGYDHTVRVHGFIIDDYNHRLMGVKFDAMDVGVMNYMNNLEVSVDNPLYTAIKGMFYMKKTLKVNKSAFEGGEDDVREFENTFWKITWMPVNPYMFGEDITTEDYKALTDALEAHKMEKFNSGSEDGSAAEEGKKLVF